MAASKLVYPKSYREALRPVISTLLDRLEARI